MSYDKAYLVQGDPINPAPYDLLAQTVTLPINVLPKGEGWRLLTGSTHHNRWARIGFRYEMDPDLGGE